MDQERNHQVELDHLEEVAQLVVEAPAHLEEVEVPDPQVVAEDHQEVPVEAEVMGSWGETLLLISMGIAPLRMHSSMSSTFTACLTSTQNR